MNLITTPAQVGYTPAATSIVHSTTASLTSRFPVQPVHLVQYDQTMPVIAVALTANGQPYTVPSGAAVNVRMNKPDGTFVYNPALGLSSDGQTAYIGITSQMTAAAGNSNPIVEIVVNEGVAGTAAFPVIIDQNPVPDSAIESSDEWLTIEQILHQVEEAAAVVQQNAQNLQNLTDNLAAVQGAAQNAQTAQSAAAEAAASAQEAEQWAEQAQQVAQDAVNLVSQSVQQAAGSASAAAASATEAAGSATAASNSASAAKESEKAAAKSAEAAADSAKQAEQAGADIGAAKDAALEAIQQAQDTGVQAVESATTTGVQAVQQAHQAALDDIATDRQQALADIEEAGDKQNAAITSGGAAALEAIGRTEQAAIGQVQQAGTAQVNAVNQAGDAKLDEINKVNALLPTPTAADAGKVVAVNSDGTGYVLSDQMFDLLYANQLNGTNTSSVFGRYAEALTAQGVAVGDILRRWFTLLWDDNTYGVKFYKFDESATPDGELIQSSATLGAATPGTNTTEAQDPYFEHGAFWAVEVAYEIEDKEVAIKAVAGVNGVTRAALLSGQYGMVGVAQKTGWYADTEDDSYYYHYYRAAPANFVADANAYRPMPEGVALDGSVRPYVVHAKYMAGRGADGKLTSASGLAAVNFISMQSQATEWRKRGADYCGICGCDLSFRMRMFWMKYGKKGNSGTLEGCSNYNYQKIAKVSETGVKRVLLTASDASGYLVGSTVSVGDKGTGTSTDRGVASMRALADKARILSIEDVQVNGTSYKALNLDAPAAFNTVAGETYISTMPWHSGSCDNVKGADGSPTSCTSGKEPFVLQLLECQPGGYAISADQLTEQVLTADAYTHRLVCFRQAAQIATSITSNAVRSPVVLTMPTNQAAAWLYQKDVEIDADGNMYAVAAGSPAGSTTGCRAAVYVPAAGSRVYAWWAWAVLVDGGVCGLSCGLAAVSCGNANWGGLAGACGSGSNRGEYAG